jgi:hypothetical protein
MAAKDVPDIRLVERMQRKTMTTGGHADPADLRDLSANVAPVSPEDLEKLRADLLAEHELRTQRIARFIKEGPLRPTPRAVVPVSENDL